MDLRASSLMSFVPWVVMAVGSTCAGLLADGLVSPTRLGMPRLAAVPPASWAGSPSVPPLP